MPSEPEHITYLLELLAGLGAVSARRMFGGHGIYHDGLMIAVVIEQRAYLKTDEQTRADFAAAGCEVWTYRGRAKPVETSYWSIPDEAMDSTEAMTPWARRAYAAALRKANAPKGKKTGVRKSVAGKTDAKKSRTVTSTADTANIPATKQSAAKKPAATKSVAKKPATRKPTAKKAASEKASPRKTEASRTRAMPATSTAPRPQSTAKKAAARKPR